MSDDQASQPARSGQLSTIAVVVGLVLLVAYLVAVAYQWVSADSVELTWSRRQQLLDGLQALGFTAAGALLGTTVQARVTKQAEVRAKTAEAKADENQRDAEKGRGLQHAIEAQLAAVDREPPSPRDVERGGVPTTAGGAAGGSGAQHLAELRELARRYDEH